MPSDPAVNAGADPFYDPRDRPGPLPKRSADAEPLTPVSLSARKPNEVTRW